MIPERRQDEQHEEPERDLDVALRAAFESDARADGSAADLLAQVSRREDGRFLRVAEIARGGLGVVWKARDTALDRDVALKLLSERRAGDPAAVARFVEEAQIGGQLAHPGIVAVHGLWLDAERRPFIAMELVEGRTLAALLAERRDPGAERSRFIAIFRQICRTIAYAHSRGVLHRDLKPANVMLGAFGEVLVVDWGLAKIVKIVARASGRTEASPGPTTIRSAPGSNSGQSVDGVVLGTPAYMAPEQARGELERVDERADVFALGAILCEILTGRPPYAGALGETAIERAAAASLDDARRRLRECDAEPAFVELAERCLAAEPTSRPRDAGEVAQALESWLASVDERVRAAGIEAAEARVATAHERRRRNLAVALAAIVVVLLGLGGGGWLWLDHERSERNRRIRETAAASLDEADSRLARGEFRLARVAAFRARELFGQSHLDRSTGEEASRRVGAVLDAVERDEAEFEQQRARADELSRLCDRLVPLLGACGDLPRPDAPATESLVQDDAALTELEAARDCWTRDPPALDAARRHLTHALSLRPTSRAAWHELAVLAGHAGELAEARDCWEEAVRRFPDAAHLRWHLETAQAVAR